MVSNPFRDINLLRVLGVGYFIVFMTYSVWILVSNLNQFKYTLEMQHFFENKLDIKEEQLLEIS